MLIFFLIAIFCLLFLQCSQQKLVQKYDNPCVVNKGDFECFFYKTVILNVTSKITKYIYI